MHLSDSFNKYETIIRCICAASVLVMIAISIAIYGAPLSGLIICMLFFIVYVQIPGMAVAEKAGLGDARLSTFFAVSLFSGWALTIAAYFLTVLMHTDLILYAIGPILSILYLLKKNKRKKTIGETSSTFHLSGVSSAFCVFFVLVLLYCLVNTQYRYLHPTAGDFAYISGDRAFHMGLINSLTHSYPLESIWVHGFTMKYHIFSEILLSVPVRLFAVGSDIAVQSFAPLLTAYCISISFYSFFREFSQKPNRAGVYCLIFILSNLYITRRWSSSFGFKQILTNDNSCGYAISAALVFLIVFSKWQDSLKNKTPHRHNLLALSTVLLMLTTGIKGPIGAVLLAALWGTLLLAVILRKNPLDMLIPLAIITAGFLLVYVLVLGAEGQVNAPGGASLGFGGITNIAFWKSSLVNAMKAAGIPKIIRMPVIMGVFCFFFFTTYTLPFFIGYIREFILVVTEKKDYSFSLVTIYAACLVGFVAMFVLHYTGHNQVYFGLVTLALAPIVSYRFIEDLENCKTASKKCRAVLRGCLVVMAACLVFSSAMLTSFFIRRIGEASEYAGQKVKISDYVCVSKDEYEAMCWIKYNTEKDALFANDRYYSVPLENYSYENRWNNTFFMYEVYSNRFSYISGSGFTLNKSDNPLRKERIDNNNKLYDPNNSERGKLARELGIDYLIVSKRFSGELKLENEDYELCYTNKDVDVYRIK